MARARRDEQWRWRKSRLVAAALHVCLLGIAVSLVRPLRETSCEPDCLILAAADSESAEMATSGSVGSFELAVEPSSPEPASFSIPWTATARATADAPRAIVASLFAHAAVPATLRSEIARAYRAIRFVAANGERNKSNGNGAIAGQPQPQSPTTGPTRAARQTFAPPPRMTSAVILGRRHGEVTLQLQISATGEVTGALLVRRSGFADLDEMAIQTVMRWRFDPALDNGQPVASDQRVTLRFRA